MALAARVNATTVARAASPARHPPSKARTSGQRLHPRPPGVLPRTPGFFSPCRRPSGPASPKNRDQRPGLWISLGRVLAQPGSYPHEQPLPKSCCTWAPRFVQPAAQTLRRRKPAPAFRKKRLSTERGRLYYYCYLYIELSKNNQNPTPGPLGHPCAGKTAVLLRTGGKKKEKGFRAAVRSVGSGQDGRVPGAEECRVSGWTESPDCYYLYSYKCLSIARRRQF